MLRAAKLTDDRNLQLRVVPLPPGTDPAELIERAGAGELRERVAASEPFVKFHVDRILERSDLTSAEGRDRAFSQLQPALRDLPKNAFGQALLQRVAGKLDLSFERLASLIEASMQRAGSGAAAVRTEQIDQRLRQEREFLALCIAIPQAGARALFAIDIDQLITSELLRRAARHIAGRTASPLADLPADDEQLARVVADLVRLAGRPGRVGEDELQHARLILELARIDRAILRAKSEGGPGIGQLARQREAVSAERRAVTGRLERAV
jgi:DNA primase